MRVKKQHVTADDFRNPLRAFLIQNLFYLIQHIFH